MPRDFRGSSKLRAFGSLNTGTVPGSLRPDESPRKENIEHASQSAARKRLGRVQDAEVKDAANCPLLGIAITQINIGAGGLGAQKFKATYITSSGGETDDLFSEGLTFGAGSDIYNYSVRARFHLKNQVVFDYDETGTNPTIRLANDDFLADFLDGTFIGFRLTSRDPKIQDETHLGVNLNNEPLWDRTEPLAIITGYDQTTRLFTLDRALPADLSGGAPIDLLMEDHAGLPIIGWNLYQEDQLTAGAFYFVARRYDHGPVLITANADTSAARPPSARVVRTAPTVVAVTTTDKDPADERTRNVESGIVGGFLRIRTTWGTNDDGILTPPGWPRTPRRIHQETWPSLHANLPISDGQGVKVTSPATPDGVDEFNAYALVLTPDNTIDYAGVTNPSAGTAAWKTTGSVANLLTLSPTAFIAEGNVSEFSTAEYGDIDDADADSVDTEAAENKQMFRLALPGADITGLGATSSLASLTLSLFVEVTRGTKYAPATKRNVQVRYYDDTGSAWVTVKSGITLTEGMQELRFGLGWDTDWPDGSDHFFVDIVGLKGLGLKLSKPSLEVHYRDEETALLAGEQSVEDGEYWQDSGLDELTLRHPLVTGAPFWQLRTNTTAQWPVDVYDWRRPGQGNTTAKDKSALIVGCANSVFLRTQQGPNAAGLRRVFAFPMLDEASGSMDQLVLEHDFQFAHVLERLIFCHPAMKDANRVFDGSSTRRHGNPTPEAGSPGSIRITEFQGEVSGDRLWHVAFRRSVVRADGFGHVVSSAPALIGEVKGALNAAVELVAQPPQEWQVTHIDFYRTLTGDPFSHLVGTREVGAPDSDGLYRIIDTLNDVELLEGFPLVTKTGRPPPSNLIAYNEGRVWLNPQGLPNTVQPTNLTDQVGNIDPEGASPATAIVPKTIKHSAISALWPHAKTLVVHTWNGSVVLEGTADRIDDADAISVRGLDGDAGAVGPKACLSIDDVHTCMTNKGVCAWVGHELRYIGEKNEGEEYWGGGVKTAEAFRFMRAFRYRAFGKDYAVYTYRDPRDRRGHIERALVSVGPGLELSTSLWTGWTQFPVHGATLIEDALGIEYALVGDHLGRIHQVDHGLTDNGRFIEGSHWTKPFDEFEMARAHQELFLYVEGRQFGERQIVLCESFMDGDPEAVEDNPARLDFSIEDPSARWVGAGAAGFRWPVEPPPAGSVAWEVDVESPRYKRVRMGLGGISAQRAFRFFQTFADLPTGHPRESTFELSSLVNVVATREHREAS